MASGFVLFDLYFSNLVLFAQVEKNVFGWKHHSCSFSSFAFLRNFDVLQEFYHVIFAHATFLLLLILIRELIKDLENIEGDLIANYKTIPVVFGEKNG